MIDFKKKITNIKGQDMPMSFASEYDLEQVKEEKGIDVVKITDMPKETVGNVLLNAISKYRVESNDQKEVFDITALAIWLNEADEDRKDLPQRLKNFLAKQILPQATSREIVVARDGKTEQRGFYSAYIIGQIYAELGIEERV